MPVQESARMFSLAGNGGVDASQASLHCAQRKGIMIVAGNWQDSPVNIVFVNA